MKKAGILILTLLLVVAMFSGCRRRSPDTTNTTMTPGTSSTTKATTPSTTKAPKATGVIPDATDLLPDTTEGSMMPRGHGGPNY